jgi:hypothetical protein
MVKNPKSAGGRAGQIIARIREQSSRYPLIRVGHDRKSLSVYTLSIFAICIVALDLNNLRFIRSP